MKRFRSILAGIPVAGIILSAAVCVLITILFVASFFIRTQVYHLVSSPEKGVGFPDIAIGIGRGVLYLGRHSMTSESVALESKGWHLHQSTDNAPVELTREMIWFSSQQGGFEVGSDARGVKVKTAEFLVPCWFFILLTGLSPAIALWRWHRRRTRIRAGHCRQCGYDLRASPERCPECGKVHPSHGMNVSGLGL